MTVSCAKYSFMHCFVPSTHLPLEKNGRHFADSIFKCILFNELFCILIQISLKFGPQGPVDNKWALIHRRVYAVLWGDELIQNQSMLCYVSIGFIVVTYKKYIKLIMIQ